MERQKLDALLGLAETAGCRPQGSACPISATTPNRAATATPAPSRRTLFDGAISLR
jgi:hypothetical protein